MNDELKASLTARCEEVIGEMEEEIAGLEELTSTLEKAVCEVIRDTEY